MSVRTAGIGHFAIPTAPAAGTSCTSGAANVFTGTYVQLIASTAAALYITGIHIQAAAASAATYKITQLAIGAAASETVIGQYLVAMTTGSTVALGYRPIYPPIPVSAGIRISVKTADSVGAQATLVTLECIAATNYVDDGVAVGTVTTVTNQLTAAAIATGVWQDATAGDFTVASSIGKAIYTGNIAPGAVGGHFIAGTNAATTVNITGNLTGNVTGSVGSVTGAVGSVTGLTASNLDATVSSRMASYAQPTGFLAATFPGTIASSTNITAATGIVLSGVTHTGAVIPTVSAVTGLTASNLDATVSSRLASASYTAPTNLTAAQIATGVWQDSVAGDFTAASSIGKALYVGNIVPGAAGGLFIAGTNAATTVNITGNITGNLTGSVGSVTGAVGSVTGLTASNLDTTISSRLATASYVAPTNLTAGQIATGVWTDTTAGDFTTALSVGKSVMNGVALGTGLTIVSVSGAVGSVTGAVGSVTGLTASNLDATISSRMASYAQPTGFLAATFPGGTIANTTNITAGTITTVTNLTNLPTIPANWITAAGVADGAIDRATFAADTGLQTVRSNTATAGTATTIILDVSASATTDFYRNALIVITGGTGVGQGRYCTAYNGTTKVATVSAWAINPDVTSTFAVIAADAIVGATAPTAAQVATQVWTDLLAGSDFSTTSSIGKLLKDNIDAATSSRMATYAQPTGFLVATFPGTIASSTNITAATGIVLSGVTHTGAVIPTVSVVTGLTASNLDATVSSRLASASYVAPTNLTAAQIATGVWTDTVGTDFTTALSVGKSIMNGVALGTGLTVAAVSGAVGSVTGSVGSVTGNVGGNVSGNVVGSVASVTSAIVLPTIPTDWITASGIATDALGALELAAGAASEIATAVRTELATELGRVDVAVSSRLATAGYTAPSNLTAAQIATGVWTDTTAGDFTTALSVGKSVMNGVALGTGLTIVSVSGAVGSVTGNVGGNVVGSVASVSGAVGSVTSAIVLPTIPTDWITANGIATDAFGALELAAGAASEIATAVRTELTTELGRIDVATSTRGTSTLTQTEVTGGAYSIQSALAVLGDARIANLDATISSRLSAAGYTAPSNLTAAQIASGVWTDTTAGDFTTALSVGKSIMNGVTLGTGLTIVSVSGSVGSVTGNVSGSVASVVGSVGSVTGLTASNLDAAISSRASQASVDTLDDYVDTEVAAIKAKTDQMTFTVANQLDANALSGGGGLNAAGVRSAVGLASANLDSQLGGLSVNTIDVWKRLGLDPLNPLINTDILISAGAGVQIAVTKSSTQTTLTRQ